MNTTSELATLLEGGAFFEAPRWQGRWWTTVDVPTPDSRNALGTKTGDSRGKIGAWRSRSDIFHHMRAVRSSDRERDRTPMARGSRRQGVTQVQMQRPAALAHELLSSTRA